MTEDAGRNERLTVRRYASSAEADRDDRRFWLEMSDADRLLYVWHLSVEQWALRGDPPYEPGLHRSVTRVIRR